MSDADFDMMLASGLVQPYAPVIEHSIAGILRWTAFQMGFRVEEIAGARRFRPFFRARCAVVWGARELRGASLPQVARVLGDRDHTSIMHAEKRAIQFRAEDAAFRLLTDRMLEVFERKAA